MPLTSTEVSAENPAAAVRGILSGTSGEFHRISDGTNSQRSRGKMSLSWLNRFVLLFYSESSVFLESFEYIIYYAVPNKINKTLIS